MRKDAPFKPQGMRRLAPDKQDLHNWKSESSSKGDAWPVTSGSQKKLMFRELCKKMNPSSNDKSASPQDPGDAHANSDQPPQRGCTKISKLIAQL